MIGTAPGTRGSGAHILGEFPTADSMLAGVDALCLGGDEAGEPIADVVRDALVGAVRSGRLPEARSHSSMKCRA